MTVAEYVAQSLIDLAAYKARTEQGMELNRIEKIYDAEWMKNAQAEVDRIQAMIDDLQTPGKYTEENAKIEIIDGVPILVADDPVGIIPEYPVEPPDDGGGDGGGHDDDGHDGDGHDGDDHDGDDHDGDDHDGDDHDDDGDDHDDDGDDHHD